VDKLPDHVLQEFLDAVEAGRAVVPIDRVFRFEQLREAHERMEASLAVGKMVVLTGT
jgi:NADPH2:quinone reductase